MQGKTDDALKVYRDSFALAERLAATDSSNMELDHDVPASYISFIEPPVGADNANRFNDLPLRERPKLVITQDESASNPGTCSACWHGLAHWQFGQVADERLVRVTAWVGAS